MASINKLSIRGVRAFSPEDDEQVVEFFFPLVRLRILVALIVRRGGIIEFVPSFFSQCF